jgi:hypothetical protein
MDGKEFDRAVARAKSPEQKVAWFGALLAHETGLGSRLVIVGGSALEVYLTSARYVSADIDIVGDKSIIIPTLQRWGFVRREGRDHRIYWFKKNVGQVDLVSATDRSGLPSRTEPTPYGEVQLGAIEYVIVRRLMRAERERSSELFRQAEVLAAQYKRSLDWEYIASEAKHEGVLPLYRQLRKQILRPQ